MSKNILDKPAMETLAELSVLLPTLATKGDIHEVAVRLTRVEDAQNSESARCPYREEVSKISGIEGDIAGLEREVKEHSKDLASVKAQIKWIAGINTTISGALAAFIAWVKGAGP